jgi:hypothetical protein
MRKKYKKKKGAPPPSFGGGGGGSSPNPGGDEDESSDNSSSATSTVARSNRSGRNALTRRKEATEVRFDTLCEPRYWRRYKRKCKKLLANASGYPDECYRWLGECEKPGIKITDLEESQHFPMIDSTFATGLIKAIPKGHEVEVELNYLEEEYEKQDVPAMVKGRQIWFLIIKHYQISEQEHKIMELKDLMNCKMRHDDLKRFQADWDMCLLCQSRQHDEILLHTLY